MEALCSSGKLVQKGLLAVGHEFVLRLGHVWIAHDHRGYFRFGMLQFLGNLLDQRSVPHCGAAEGCLIAQSGSMLDQSVDYRY